MSGQPVSNLRARRARILRAARLESTSMGAASPQFRDDRLGCIDLVADARARYRIGREVQVDARAEPDEAVTLPAHHSIARLHVAQDPSGDQSGDLDTCDVRARRSH